MTIVTYDNRQEVQEILFLLSFLINIHYQQRDRMICYNLLRNDISVSKLRQNHHPKFPISTWSSFITSSETVRPLGPDLSNVLNFI